MKPEHKKYILENISQKSVQQIARELGLKERKVKRFLEREGPGRGKEAPRKEDRIFAKKTYSRLSEMLIFFGIVLVAFAVRLVYLEQIRTNPFFTPFYHGLDDYLYDSWARAIAGGDILGKEVFYGLPLYPYFLGFMYFLFGPNVFIAKMAQVIIGSLSCGFVYIIGRRVFNRPVGIIASLLLAFYSMAVYFEGFFVSPFLAIFLNCLAALVILSALEESSFSRWIIAGILIGLSSLANASVLVFLLLVIAWALWSFREMPKKKVALSMLSMLAAVVLVILPVTVRNYVVGRDFVPVTAHSGITFYAGNNPLSEGSFKMPRSVGTSVVDSKENAKTIAERVTERELKPSEVSRFWFGQSLGFIKAQPARFAWLELRKIFLFWNAYEIPDVLPMAFFKRYSPLLRMPLVSFAFICPLALVGMFLCMRTKRRDILLLGIFVLGIYISTVIYFVNSRYRLIAVPFLAVFAAVTVYWYILKLKEKDLRALILPSAAILALAVLTHVKVLDFRLEQSHNNLGIALKRQGLYQEAIIEYKKAIEMNPDYDSPYFNLGLLYMERGQNREAIDNFNEALRINPDFVKAHNKIGMVYSKMGEREKAVFHWKWSLELDPGQEEIKALMRRYE